VQQFTKKEIEDLLRKGAYAAIMDENDEGNRFCEEDIDQILQRRATTVTVESERKGSTFSKASFVASENRNDIALDDPEFWQKWAKKADIDIETMNRKVSAGFFKVLLPQHGKHWMYSLMYYVQGSYGHGKPGKVLTF